jgi:hypothetical protein
MEFSQSAACARCDKNDCLAIVIIPAISDDEKRLDHQTLRLEIICPACRRSFSVGTEEIDHFDVTDEQITRRFITGVVH